MIIILMITILALSVAIVFSSKVILNTRENISELHDEIVKLEKSNEKKDVELEKNREIYNFDKKALIEENRRLHIELEKCKHKLSKFSEEESRYYSELDNVNNFTREMTPEEFIELSKKVNNSDSGLYDFTGIYILENKTYDKFYVGQSISLFRRVSSHFTGHGNKDIYEDYMEGNEWTIRLIALSDSGFKSINALEKHFIEYYHSTYNGYNRTVGNRH